MTRPTSSPIQPPDIEHELQPTSQHHRSSERLQHDPSNNFSGMIIIPSQSRRALERGDSPCPSQTPSPDHTYELLAHDEALSRAKPPTPSSAELPTPSREQLDLTQSRALPLPFPFDLFLTDDDAELRRAGTPRAVEGDEGRGRRASLGEEASRVTRDEEAAAGGSAESTAAVELRKFGRRLTPGCTGRCWP